MANTRKFTPTATHIERLHQLRSKGASWSAIARDFGITLQTLRKNFRNQMDEWEGKDGRPEFKKTKDNAHIVRNLKILGYTNDEIGIAIGCGKDTLLKHFREELDQAPMLADAKALDVIEKHMNKGSAAHAKMYWDQIRGRAANVKNDHTTSDGSMAPPQITRTVIEVDPNRVAEVSAEMDDLAKQHREYAEGD